MSFVFSSYRHSFSLGKAFPIIHPKGDLGRRTGPSLKLSCVDQKQERGDTIAYMLMPYKLIASSEFPGEQPYHQARHTFNHKLVSMIGFTFRLGVKHEKQTQVALVKLVRSLCFSKSLKILAEL